MTRAPQRSLRRAVELAKAVLVAALAFTVVSAWGASATGSAGPGAPSGPTTDPLVSAVPSDQARWETLMSRHSCSTTGFGPDVIPGSSLVLRDERVRHLSFDDGWAVHTGEQPGVLLAVCLATV